MSSSSHLDAWGKARKRRDDGISLHVQDHQDALINWRVQWVPSPKIIREVLHKNTLENYILESTRSILSLFNYFKNTLRAGTFFFVWGVWIHKNLQEFAKFKAFLSGFFSFFLLMILEESAYRGLGGMSWSWIYPGDFTWYKGDGSWFNFILKKIWGQNKGNKGSSFFLVPEKKMRIFPREFAGETNLPEPKMANFFVLAEPGHVLFKFRLLYFFVIRCSSWASNQIHFAHASKTPQVNNSKRDLFCKNPCWRVSPLGWHDTSAPQKNEMHRSQDVQRCICQIFYSEQRQKYPRGLEQGNLASYVWIHQKKVTKMLFLPSVWFSGNWLYLKGKKLLEIHPFFTYSI